MIDDTKAAGPTKAAPKRQSRKPDARRQLAEMKAKQEEMRLEDEMKAQSGHDWFVRCRRCHGVAVFLTKYPKGGLVDQDMWYSDYRELETTYIADKIHCQECGKSIGAHFAKGIRGSWSVFERFYQSVEDIEKRQEKADLERAQTRAMQVAKVSIMEAE